MTLTTDEIKQIEKLRQEGKSHRQISKIMNLDRGTVGKYIGIVKRIELKAQAAALQQEETESIPLEGEQCSDSTIGGEPMAVDATDTYEKDSQGSVQTTPFPVTDTVATDIQTESPEQPVQQLSQKSSFSRIIDDMAEMMSMAMMDKMIERLSPESADEDLFDRILKIKEKQLEMRLFDKVMS